MARCAPELESTDRPIIIFDITRSKKTELCTCQWFGCSSYETVTRGSYENHMVTVLLNESTQRVHRCGVVIDVFNYQIIWTNGT